MTEAAESNDNLESDQAQNALPGWLFPALFVTAALCCFAGERVIMSVDRFYYPPPHGQLGDPPEYTAAVRWAMTRNRAIGFGAMGCVLFAVIGAFVGCAVKPKRIPLGIVLGAIVGLVVGGLAAAGAFWLESYQFWRDGEGTGAWYMHPIVRSSTVLGLPFVLFGICGATLAIVVGKARSPANAIMTAIFIPIVLMVVHMIFAMAAFPMGRTESIFPEDVYVRYSELFFLTLSGALVTFLAVKGPRQR